MTQVVTDALMRQIGIMQDAAGMLRGAIDNLTGSINPEVATWADVGRFAHIADAARRFVETIEESAA